MPQEPRPNLNHMRTDVPIRFCPMCGEVVNGSILIPKCCAERHAARRREGDTYCMDCGERLIDAKRP